MDRDQRRARRARRLLLGAPLAVLVLVVVTALASPSTLWPTVDGDGLGVSLGRTLDASVVENCPRDGGSWRCVVARDATSGVSATYRVTVRGDDRCWDAVRAPDGDAGLPRTARGCVSALDHLLP